MKKWIGGISCMLFSGMVSAQTVDNKVLNTAGGSKLSGNLFLEFNLGESFVASHLGAAVQLTDGLLQPFAATGSAPPIPSFPITQLPTGIDNAGNSVTIGNLFLENTLGEFMTAPRTGTGYMLTQGILQPGGFVFNAPLPVTGLEFYARRISARYVQLDWKTLQEFNNAGFWVERKKEAEDKFTALKLIPSKSTDGNSSLPLDYREIDTTEGGGKLYYRLKQQDRDGKFTYSVIGLVQGGDQTAMLKVWPIPAPRDFQVAVSGLEMDWVQVYDAGGKLIKQVSIRGSEVVRVTGLVPGVYIVRIKNQPGLVQKISVQ